MMEVTKLVETMMNSAGNNETTRNKTRFPSHVLQDPLTPSSRPDESTFSSTVLENLSVTQRLIPNMGFRWRSSAAAAATAAAGRKRQSSVQHLLEILDTAIMILELDVVNVEKSFPTDRSSDA